MYVEVKVTDFDVRKKIGIVTFFKGNYGSMLQCYATCITLKGFGFSPLVFEKKENRYANLLRFAARCLSRPKYIKTFLNIRKKAFSGSSRLSKNDKLFMNEFITNKLPIIQVSASKMRRLGNSEQFIAFFSGSDQIWGGHEYIIDPMRFLRFAPKSKRIAWAPSFGTSDIAKYNKRTYKKYISQYKHLSVRETSAVDLVSELTGKMAIPLADPVFLLTRNQWSTLFVNVPVKQYLMCYFLDKLSPTTVQQINNFCETHNLKVVVFGPTNDSYEEIKSEKIYGGPEMFVSLISHAQCVFTDSFHALSFSLIMNTPFFVYKRNYAHGIDQSSRVKTLLGKTGMQQFFDPQTVLDINWNFSYSNDVISEERQSLLKYLCGCLDINTEV